MTTLTESVDSLKNYVNKHKDDKVNESVDPQQLIEEFENKLKDTLTESEMSFVKEITDWRSPIAEQRKEKLFNKFKNECIDKVNDMLKEDAGNAELESLKKQLEEQKFNKETIVQDIAKLLEIRDILLDS
jgi:ribonuclease D